jgi:type VI secretion system protein ImpC
MSAIAKQEQPDSQRAGTEESLLEAAIGATRQTEPDRARELIRTLTEAATDESLRGAIRFDRNVIKTITAGVEAIDAVISQQLAAIMHKPEFLALEGSWRGLHYLVRQTETGESIQLRVLNCSKRDLRKDFEQATEFDQSNLFKKIYETEFGSPGGAPYGALIGDFEFENHPEDLALLESVSGVAAAGFCPFLSAASPRMLGFDCWQELSRSRDLKTIVQSQEYTKWMSFRDSEDSRFVALTMPRTLARLPYGRNTKPIDEFHYEEVALGPKGESIAVPHDQYCWMNTAYVLGTKLTAAFAATSFCTTIRGYENGGLVEGLPAHIFATDEGDVDVKCPTEIAITDRREKELSDMGFLSLNHYKGKDYAVFFGAQTAQRPKKYDRPNATENAQICARLPYVMATSRFSHYLKVIGRDWIGSFKEAEDLEREIDRWIHNYVSADPNPNEKARANYPLREAKVQVRPVSGKSGAYEAIAWLRPWLQLEELTTSMRMVARIPQVGS